MQPRKIEYVSHGFYVEHDQPCAVLFNQHAVYNINKDIFEPSWAAQDEGWKLVRAETRFQRWLLRRFFR